MKFKAPILPTYEHGSIESKMRFAWLPKRVGDAYIWLGQYEAVYTYQVVKMTGVLNGKPVEVTVKQWFKVEERAL